MAAAAAQF